ncbi:hypothetical protein LSTR_LSTR016424 [Laodelphax striatellus]|uniref:BESS domain-containing protein n=1 Tax=Laodelphax striatellus TaxID=195883 RepID=A0A482WHH9_LAOST|nr:hypothetical protein LSTR_LSTR016424 [Laodelphax striatellus]
MSLVDADNEEEQPAIDNEHVYLDAFEVDIDQPTNRSEETSEAQKKKKKISKDDDSDYLMELLKPREEHVTQSRKRIHDPLSQNDDEIDLFFKAMAATVKKFTFEEQVETKSQVFNIINKIEGRSLKQ